MTRKQLETLFVSILDKLINNTFKSLNPFFINQGKNIIKNIFKTNLKNDINVVMNNILTPEVINNEKLKTIISKTFNIGFRSGVNFTAKSNDRILLNALNLQNIVEDYINLNIGNEIMNINTTTEKQVKTIILNSLSKGDTIKETAQKIKNITLINSNSRALTIARTESHNAIMGGSFNSALLSGLGLKTWNTVADERVRDSHESINGQEQEINKKFTNGLIYPGDSINGSAKEVINCRCFLTYQ